MREKPNGSIEYRFVIDGKRYSVTAKSAKELARKEQELRTKVAQGTYIKNGGGTLDEYFEKWIDRKKLVLKDSSVLRYMIWYNKHIKYAIGKKRRTDVTRTDILNLRKDVAKNVSAYTANRAVTVINIIFKEAVRDGIIKENPAENIQHMKTDKKKAAKTIHRALTMEEQTAFMEEAGTSIYRNVFAIALATGMRIGEILALSWDDIYDGYIHVNKTIGIGMHGNPVIHDTPKTEKSIRMIPVTDTIKRILEDQRIISEALPARQHPELIFHSSEGHIGNTGKVGNDVKNILRRLDNKGVHIEHFSPHALRDTFATRYIEQGGSMHTLRDILGHSALAMTMDLYAHVMPETIKSEMDRFDPGL